MNKKVFKSFLIFVLLLPCFLILTACGGLKTLEDKTLVYSKVEVTGSLKVEDYEKEYKSISFTFAENTVKYVDGSSEDTYDYKLEDGKVYLKGADEEFSTKHYAEISGGYMVVTETYSDGVVKVYFKVK